MQRENRSLNRIIPNGSQKIIGRVKPPDFVFYGDFMNSRIKLSARAALNGSQLKIVPSVTAVMFLVLLFSVCNAAVNAFFSAEYILVAFSALSLVLAVALISPLRLRLEIKHLLLARRINPSAKINLGFKGALKSCGMCVCLFLLKLFWLAVFELIPILAAAVFFLYSAEEAISFKAACVILFGISALAVIGLCFYFLFIQRYSKAMFYLACFKDMSVIDAIEESVRKTKNSLADILLFKLGFAPWFLLCIAVIPALFVVPYYKQSLMCYFLYKR